MSNPRDNIRPLHSEGGDLGARDSLERDTIALGLSETLSPDQLHRLDLIEPADFARPSYARVWEARTEVVNGGHTPTVENVAAIMDDREAWSGEVSNAADLAVIAAGVPSVNDLPAVMRSLKGARTATDKAKAHSDTARAYLNAAEDYAYRRDAGGAMVKAAEAETKAHELRTSTGRGPLFVPISQANVERVTEVVDGMIAQGTLGMLVGADGVGKTLAAVALSCSVATGAPFLGHIIRKPGPVLYLASEGLESIRPRVAAWAKHHGKDMADLDGIHLSTIEAGTLALLNPADTQAIIDDIDRLGIKPAMVVIDTLAMAGGLEDENSAAQMGALMANLRRIAEASGAYVMVVHHAGKGEGAKYRGSSALRAACSTVLTLNGSGDAMSLKLDKYRHGQGGVVVPVMLDPGHVVDDDPTSDRAPRATPVLVEGRGKPALDDDAIVDMLEDMGAYDTEGAALADLKAELVLFDMDTNAVNRRLRSLRKAGIVRDKSPRGRVHLIGAPDELDGLIT